MADSKEFQAFDSLIGKLLKVPRERIVKRVAEHREKAAKNPRKRGPKKKTP